MYRVGKITDFRMQENYFSPAFCILEFLQPITICEQSRRFFGHLELGWRQIATVVKLFTTKLNLGEPKLMNQLDSNPESRMWAMVAHISALSGFVIPFGNILGPLIVWLVKRDEMAFVEDQGKEALNFNISITIYGIISALLIFVLIGFALLLILGVVWLVFVILAAVKANEGTAYRYPLTLRLIK
jgi:hypothetical protein